MLILWPLAFIVLSIYYEWEDFQSYTKILIEIYIQCNDNIYFYSLYFLTQQLLSCNNVIPVVYVGETQKFSNTIFMLFLIYKIIYYYVLATAFFVWTLLLAQLFLFFFGVSATPASHQKSYSAQKKYYQYYEVGYKEYLTLFGIFKMKMSMIYSISIFKL